MENVQAVIDALRRAPDVVVPLVKEVPPQILKKRPAPKRWSAHEHACHLAHVHALFFERLESMLTRPAPVITPYLPGDQDADDLLLKMDLDDSLHRFVADRARLVARLESLSPTEWSKSAEHGEYRMYSVFIMFRHLALHDFLHAYRIEELLLQKERSMPHGKICYLEIPANKAKDAASFYSGIFGWKVRERGDGNLAFDDSGSVSGTWVKEADRTPDERTRVYIMVDSIAESLKMIKAAGGKVLTPRKEIGPNMGAFAAFADPVGNEFGLYEEPQR